MSAHAPVTEVVSATVPPVAPADAEVLIVGVDVGGAVTVRPLVVAVPGRGAVVVRFELIVARLDLDRRVGVGSRRLARHRPRPRPGGWGRLRGRLGEHLQILVVGKVLEAGGLLAHLDGWRAEGLRN